MPTYMIGPRRLSLVIVSLLHFSTLLSAQDAGRFPMTALRVVAVDHRGGIPIAGKVILAEDAVSFESSEVVFTLPTKEIKSVEYQGVREGFLQFVLDEKSSFIGSYPMLLVKRNDAYGQLVALVQLSLDPTERVDAAAKIAGTFQALVARQNAAAAKAMVGSVHASAEEQAAHPSLGRTVQVVVQEINDIGMKLAVVHGLLTFFPEHLELNSREVNFAIPYAVIQQVDCAGARDTFLLVHIDPKDKFNKLYPRYRINSGIDPAVRFMLDMTEEVAPSYKTALDFQKYMQELQLRRNHAMIGVIGSAEKPQPASDTVAPPSAQKTEVGRFGVGFLERHSPKSSLNGWKVINGIPGSLIVFDSGFGYVSDAQEPTVKPGKKQFFQDGYLKFFVPNEAIGGVRNVSVIRGNRSADPSLNTYIVEIDIAADSEFHRLHAGLMAESDQENCLFIKLKDRLELDRFLKFLRPISRKDQF